MINKLRDVQAIHVGIGRQNHLLIAQLFEIVLDVEAPHQIVHLVIFIDDVAFEVPDIERLAFQDKDGLGIDIATTDDGAGLPTGLR